MATKVKPKPIPAPTGKLGDAFRLVLPIPADIGKVRAQATRLREERNKLLPIEAAARRHLDRTLATLDLMAEKLVERGYRPMSLEPLSWRNDRGLPVLALFDVEREPTLLIRMDSYGRVPQITPELPIPLRDCYNDLARGATYTAKFAGVIPNEVREIILGLQKEKALDHVERRQPFERLFLLAESQWERRDIPLPPPAPRRDPLLLGWNGKTLWYITHFDVTPLEEYVKAEFPA